MDHKIGDKWFCFEKNKSFVLVSRANDIVRAFYIIWEDQIWEYDNETVFPKYNIVFDEDLDLAIKYKRV